MDCSKQEADVYIYMYMYRDKETINQKALIQFIGAYTTVVPFCINDSPV